MWVFAIYVLVGIVSATTTKRSMRTMFGESGRDEGSGEEEYPDESGLRFDTDMFITGSGDDDEDAEDDSAASGSSGFGSGTSGDGGDYENIFLTKISPDDGQDERMDGNKKDVVVDVVTTASSRNKKQFISRPSEKDAHTVKSTKNNENKEEFVVDVYTTANTANTANPAPTDAVASQTARGKNFTGKEKIVIGVLGGASFFLLLFAACTFFRKRKAKKTVKAKTDEDLTFL